MEYLFTEKNIEKLEALLNVNTVYAFDFDGTLAPLVEDRDSAKMSLTTERLMGNLIKQQKVAIITGRELKDIESLLDIKPHYLIGNHGSEGVLSNDDLTKVINRNDFYRSHLNTFNTQFEKYGIEIEEKTYSVSVHYRKSLNVQETEKFISKMVSDLSDAKLIPGKFILNILPPGTLHKGQAFTSIMQQDNFNSGFFIGDDVTDEDVFRINDSKVFTVRVGESPASQASYFIKDQSEINMLLKHLSKVSGLD